jgi:release factor glutamine methyltransferase
MRNGPVTVYDSAGNLIRGSEDIPPQYLKGWVEWYKLKFKVTPDVLIPRPETELLVDEVLKGVRPLTQQTRGRTPVVLDIGTGSGCIAISIAKNSSKTKIFAIDVSESALEVARENAKKNRVEKRIFFLQGNLLDSIGGPSGLQNDNLIIVANLPYIPTSRIGTLDPSVKDFEPHIALDGGPDGFEIYRRLFSQMKEKKLTPRFFIGEIDETHATLALSEAKKYFPQSKAEVKTDLAHKPRMLLISFK